MCYEFFTTISFCMTIDRVYRRFIQGGTFIPTTGREGKEGRKEKETRNIFFGKRGRKVGTG